MGSAKKRKNEQPESFNNKELKICLLGLCQSRSSACCQRVLLVGVLLGFFKWGVGV